MIRVDVSGHRGAEPPDEDLHRWVRAAVEAGADPVPGDAEVAIRIVDETESAELNGRYRDRAHATNVLSFPADVPRELDWPLLGDLAICGPVVRREAAEQGKDEDAHWAHMVVHGVLHLLGHDHQQESEAAAMEALESRVMARLGYPDPYIVEDAPLEGRAEG